MIDMIPRVEQFRDRACSATRWSCTSAPTARSAEETSDSFLATLADVPQRDPPHRRGRPRAGRPGTTSCCAPAEHVPDNKILLDWERRSAECPGQCFYGDGIHLRPEGQQYYADLISDVLGI